MLIVGLPEPADHCARAAVERLRLDGRAVFGGPIGTAAVLAIETTSRPTVDELLIEHNLAKEPTIALTFPRSDGDRRRSQGMIPTAELRRTQPSPTGSSSRVVLVVSTCSSAVGRGGMFGLTVDTFGAVHSTASTASPRRSDAACRLRRGDVDVLRPLRLARAPRDRPSAQIERDAIHTWWRHGKPRRGTADRTDEQDRRRAQRTAQHRRPCRRDQHGRPTRTIAGGRGRRRRITTGATTAAARRRGDIVPRQDDVDRRSSSAAMARYVPPAATEASASRPPT